MRVKLLIGALLICGLLTVPASVEAGCFGGSGLFGGGGLFRGGGCNILSGLRSGRSLRMTRRVGRHSERVVRVGERSALIINGRRSCAAGQCDLEVSPEAPPEVVSEPDTNDGAVLDSGSLLDINSNLLGGEGISLHIPSPGSIWSGLNLAGRSR